LKLLTITIYRTIADYENIFLPVLQCLSNVEYLTLFLAVGYDGIRLNHFIDGYDLEKDIISYMPHLRQFHFHIRSILRNASYTEIDTIRQSFLKYQHKQSVDCAVDYFNDNYSQCQIYSLPFLGTRLDFISNRFPLFDINKTFSMVTNLLLFDDVQSFESDFFERVSRALPHLRTLDVFNGLEQQVKAKTTTNNLQFAHLTTLILFDSHFDYAKQLLSLAHLPSLVELAINNDVLLTIITQNEQQAKENCSKVQSLRTSTPFGHLLDKLQNFFPSHCYVIHPDEVKIKKK
jgi:hypothetical protein